MNYAALPDHDLAALLQAGDHAAFTEIFERYHTLLLKHAFRLLKDEDEAGDLVQDFFLTVWQKHESIVFRSSLAAYLYTGIRNRVLDRLSHLEVVSSYADSISAFMHRNDYQPDRLLLDKELAAIIEREISNLPPKMQAVFRLSREQNLSYQEIAEELGITDQTAKLQVHNAVKILRLRLRYLFIFLTLFY